jgi:hypothetical protein
LVEKAKTYYCGQVLFILRLNNEGLRNMHASPNIIRVIKSKKSAGHVARMEEKRNAYILIGKPEVKRPLEDVDVDGNIMS